MTRITAADPAVSRCALVCGGRNFKDRAELADTLDGLHQERGFALMIAGGSHGADRLTEEWAGTHGLTCEVYHTDWVLLGRDAGHIRNRRMLAEGRPELVVAFPGGRRTAHLVQLARNAGIEVIEAAPRRFFAFALWRKVTTALTGAGRTVWSPDQSAVLPKPSAFPGAAANLGAERPGAIARPLFPESGCGAPAQAGWNVGAQTAQLTLPGSCDLRTVEGFFGGEGEKPPADAKDAA
jgi:hypothetical protein